MVETNLLKELIDVVVGIAALVVFTALVFAGPIALIWWLA